MKRTDMNIRKILLTVTVSLSMLLVYGSASVSKSELWKPYNVKDYGAVGNGKHDDSDAIQRCITEVEKKNHQFYYNETAYPEIIFPSGNYLISRPIVIAADRKSMNLAIRGNGQVTITQQNPEQDIFYMHYGYRQSIQNISFVGGKNQIKFFSRNFNRAQLVVKNCRFIDSSSYAIDDALKGVHHSKIVAPYEITWKDSLPYAVPVDVDQLPDVFFTSSIMHVDACEFINCQYAVRAFADWGIISNSKIITNPSMKGAAIYSRGVLKIKDSSCFAKNRNNNQQRFVDNINAGIMLQNVAIDTDGTGICPIYNRRIYDNGGLYNIYAIIDNCNIKAAGSPENSFVYCEEIPNLIRISDSTETSGKKIPGVNFRLPVTKEYLQQVSFPDMVKRLPELSQIYGYMVSMPRIYTISETKYLHNFAFALYNNKNLNEKLPAVLEQFNEKPLPDNVMAKFNSEKTCRDRALFTIKQSINIYSFGAKGDGKHDDTAAIQRAFDQAGKTAGTELVFPNGLYNLSKPIVLPEKVAVRGLGMACFKGISGNKTLFTGDNIIHLAFSNAAFTFTDNALMLTTSPSEKADITFDNCYFSDIKGIALSCLAGGTEKNIKNQTYLHVKDCNFAVMDQLAVSNAAEALFEYNWISLYSKEKVTVFTNYGKMRIADCIGVPSVAASALWINNHQTIIVDNMRFGGEGPFTKDLIENNDPNGQIYMRYSWLCCDKGAIIICNQTPVVAALTDNFGPPDAAFQTMVLMNQATKDQGTEFILESRNITPSNVK